MRHLPVLATATCSVLAAVLLAPAAHGTTEGGRPDNLVEIEDDCDPVTFTEALGPGACVGDGETTFQALVDSLATTGDADEWRMHPRRMSVVKGVPVRLHNTGGEFHTFTEVPAFGAGCVEPINQLLGLTGPPVADCAASLSDPRTALPAGARGRVDTAGMSVGRHSFECMVHPWMTARVTVTRR